MPVDAGDAGSDTGDLRHQPPAPARGETRMTTASDPRGPLAGAFRSLFRFMQRDPTRIRSSGTYRILGRLGAGGMGAVYLAEKRGIAGFSKLVAIKVIRKSRLQDPMIRDMFIGEAKLVANLVHPHIIQVFQLGRTRSTYFIVMEHVFGVNLLQFIDRHRELDRRIPVDFGAHVIARICRGLHYAHRKHSRDGRPLNIVHRDICPTNIMISFRGIPKLSDFGVAKARTTLLFSEREMTFGKYPYMSPEQVRKLGTDHRSDIYSLGLVMYELFTGRLAFTATNTSDLVVALEQAPLVLERDRHPDVPEGLLAVIRRATQPDPADRFQSAKEMAIAIEQFLLLNFLFPEEESLSDYLVEIFPHAMKHRWW